MLTNRLNDTVIFVIGLAGSVHHCGAGIVAYRVAQANVCCLQYEHVVSWFFAFNSSAQSYAKGRRC